jgi:hypothetical protein
MFLKELLENSELWEINYEDKEGVDFVKWNHKFWLPKLLR